LFAAKNWRAADDDHWLIAATHGSSWNKQTLYNIARIRDTVMPLFAGMHFPVMLQRTEIPAQ